MSQLKIKNGNNWESIPAGGIGVPSGGTTGQLLQKSSNTDYATEWADLPRYPIVTGQLTELISFQSSGKVNTIQKQGNLVVITFYATFAAGMSSAYQSILQIPDAFAPPSGSHFGIVGNHNNASTVFAWVEYINNQWCINYGVKASAGAYTTFQIIYLTD